MANHNFEAAANNTERNAMTSGDNNVSKINFSDVMHDPLSDALRKSNDACAHAAARVAAVQERIANYFGDDRQAHQNFMEDHNKYYAQA